jgi:FKBP-type peptidyl-prolyl cis-trans isomerase
MRRTVPALLLVLAACGGGDDTTSADEPTSSVVIPTSIVNSPLLPAEGCEDAPDAADYEVGAIPQAVRPCEIPTALVTHTIRSGTGRNAQDGDTLFVDYIGIRADDGAIFDESYSRGTPLEFPLGRGGVIQGWDDGLIGTQAGGLVKLDVPTELAYGDNPPGGADGDIRPGDALSFIVEIRAVVEPVTAEDAPLDLRIEPSIGATEVTLTELTPGDGAVVDAGDTAIVRMLLVRGDNEVVLFNTWERSGSYEKVPLEEGQTLPGLLQKLPGTRVGSRVAIAMPPADAFGEDGQTSLGLPAGVDLIAIVDVVGVY